ncbi:MAG: hypothetical protein Q4E88_02285 [Coriobacteriia bacterium]|nr:hypothetical protein [Coriobacteriia bacterium]
MNSESEQIDLSNQILDIVHVDSSGLHDYFNSDDFSNDIDDGLQTIPVISKLVKLGKLCFTVRDNLFYHKLKLYLMDYAELTDKDKKKFSKKIEKHAIYHEDLFILEIIDKTEEYEKISIYSKLSHLLMKEKINRNEFRRYMLMTKNTPYQDLLYLKNNWNKSIENNNMKTEEISLNANGWLTPMNSELTFTYEDDGSTGKNNMMTGYEFNDVAIKFCELVFNKKL